jgi:hypothetical protein
MSWYQHAILSLLLFLFGFLCGNMLPTASCCNTEIAEKVTPLMEAGDKAPSLAQIPQQNEIIHYLANCDARVDLELDVGRVSAETYPAALPINLSQQYSDLKERIDHLPEIFINKQLEQVFDENYLDSVNDRRALAKKLVDVALADGNPMSSDMENMESANIEIEFSLSPIPGLRQFGNSVEIDQHDKIFAHFISSADHTNLMVRWLHRDTGEILIFSPLKLYQDQGKYISLTPRNGWQPGSYMIGLFDLNNNQKLVTSRAYTIDNILLSERQPGQADSDVINDLISSGLAVPKVRN